MSLITTAEGLAFFAPEIAKTPFRIAFETGKLAYRSAKSVQQKELIARACLLKNLNRPTKILDATAGFGRDAFILATSGANVTLVERHPIIAALLEDALKRLQNVEIKSRLTLIQQDAKDVLRALKFSETKPEVIYLDPMFHIERNAKVKKDLQILQFILADAPYDQHDLLPLALEAARCRVVVKRAIFAEPLNHAPPAFSLKGKHSRFDIYLAKE